MTNPKGPSTGANRVDRGGSWDVGASYHRASYRGDYALSDIDVGLGLRLARD